MNKSIVDLFDSHANEILNQILDESKKDAPDNKYKTRMDERYFQIKQLRESSKFKKRICDANAYIGDKLKIVEDGGFLSGEEANTFIAYHLFLKSIYVDTHKGAYSLYKKLNVGDCIIERDKNSVLVEKISNGKKKFVFNKDLYIDKLKSLLENDVVSFPF